MPAGETVEVRLDFPEPPPLAEPIFAHAAPLPLAADRSTPVAYRSRAPAVTSFVVGAAGAAVGTVFGVLTLGDKSRLAGECDGKACPPGSQRDIDSVSRDGTISTIAFGVAAAGVVTGVALWITSGPSRPAQAGSLTGFPATAPVRFGPGFVAGSF